VKRTLTAVLLAGALLLAGCAHATAAPAPAAATHPAATTTAPPSPVVKKTDVADLLGQIDKQLDTDDQPHSEQD
jgi:PBP1b-binding outer membrane lipoprotein LpoB